LKEYLIGAIRIFNIRRYNFSKIYRYLDIRRFNFSKILSSQKTKSVRFYFIASVILISITYLIMPLFYKYDKSKIENIVCADFKYKCSIKGKVNYSFIPSPRIKLKNFIIEDSSGSKKKLLKIEKVIIKISLANLFNKEKFNYTQIQIYNVEVNLNTKKLKNYKKFYSKKFNFKPIKVKGGIINFYEDAKYITNISNIKFKHKPGREKNKIVLNGDFLDDKLEIEVLNNKSSEEKDLAILSLKLANQKLFTKVNIFNKTKETDSIKGSVLFKRNKARLKAFFDYKGNQIIFEKANFRNPILDGKFSGILELSPFFQFDLSVDLNAINFNKIHSLLSNLDEFETKNLFNINRKINGKLNLSTNKIYSKYNLVRSFESRLKFINGNILVEQLLLNLGKLGAADLTGSIENKSKFISFKFEKNIFVDNKKFFFSKFSVYNKEDISSNLFISGNIDLTNLSMHLYEISEDKDKKLAAKDIEYMEKEFNNILFENGYKSFFDFLKLKEYVKTVLSE